LPAIDDIELPQNLSKQEEASPPWNDRHGVLPDERKL
jgi:hypothetical protein